MIAEIKNLFFLFLSFSDIGKCDYRSDDFTVQNLRICRISHWETRTIFPAEHFILLGYGFSPIDGMIDPAFFFRHWKTFAGPVMNQYMTVLADDFVYPRRFSALSLMNVNFPFVSMP